MKRKKPANAGTRACSVVLPEALGGQPCIQPFGVEGHEMIQQRRGVLWSPVLVHRSADGFQWYQLDGEAVPLAPRPVER